MMKIVLAFLIICPQWYQRSRYSVQMTGFIARGGTMAGKDTSGGSPSSSQPSIDQ